MHFMLAHSLNSLEGFQLWQEVVLVVVDLEEVAVVGEDLKAAYAPNYSDKEGKPKL